MGKMIDNLADIPAAILSLASDSYLRASKYFPSASELREHALPIQQAVNKDLGYVNSILEYVRPEPLERMTGERMAKIRAESQTESRFPKLKDHTGNTV